MIDAHGTDNRSMWQRCFCGQLWATEDLELVLVRRVPLSNARVKGHPSYRELNASVFHGLLEL